MNVGELKKMLDKYPDDMEILTTRCSDYDVVQEREWTIVNAVPNDSGGWVMRAHETMSDDNKAKAKEYLHISGN